MILPPTVRVFFAIDLPQATKTEVANYIDSLQKMSKANVVRWSKPENLHITLQFLAEVKSEHIPEMLAKVRRKLLTAKEHITISLKELHLFPDPHRPRVLVLDVAPQETLATLSKLVGDGIVEAGYEIEKRSFRAHMTIGRVKTNKMSALSFLSDATVPDIADVDVNEVVLFQSQPQPDGSRYVPIECLTFASVNKCA